METENKILGNEMGQGGVLNSVPKVMPYHLPENYFQSFGVDLVGTIKSIDQDDVNAEWGKTNPYILPSGYFNKFSSDLFEKIYSENGLNESKIQLPYEVPQGYFDAFKSNILQKVKHNGREVTRLIRLGLIKPIKYAAAAILVLGLGIGGLLIFQNNNAMNQDGNLASVPKNELNEFAAQNYPELDIDLTSLNNMNNSLKFESNDIIQYLNETGWEGIE